MVWNSAACVHPPALSSAGILTRSISNVGSCRGPAMFPKAYSSTRDPCQRSGLGRLAQSFSSARPQAPWRNRRPKEAVSKRGCSGGVLTAGLCFSITSAIRDRRYSIEMRVLRQPQDQTAPRTASESSPRQFTPPDLALAQTPMGLVVLRWRRDREFILEAKKWQS